jgi:hypothetical protein
LYLDDEAANPWRKVGRVAFCAAAILAMRGFVEVVHLRHGQFPNRPGWLFSIALAAILGTVVGYWLPRLILLLPGSIVILSEKGVNNNVIATSVSVKFWPWELIDHARFGKQTVRGRAFSVLTLYDDNDTRLATFALREHPGHSEIAAYLLEHGMLCRDES